MRRTRDAYSFLPTLGEADLYLFGKGDERRIYEKLGAQLREIDGVAGRRALPSGRRTPNASASWAISITGTDATTRCARWDRPGVWEIFIPGVGEGRALQIRESERCTGAHYS